MLRSNEEPHPPTWLDAMKRQFEKLQERKNYWMKKLKKQREIKAEKKRIQEERKNAKNRAKRLGKHVASPSRRAPPDTVSVAQAAATTVNPDGEVVEEEEEDEEEDGDAEFDEDGEYMNTETDGNLACLCFEFSCKEGK